MSPHVPRGLNGICGATCESRQAPRQVSHVGMAYFHGKVRHGLLFGKVRQVMHDGLLLPTSRVRHDGLVMHALEGSKAWSKAYGGGGAWLTFMAYLAYFHGLLWSHDGLVRHEVRHEVRHAVRHEVRLTFLKTNVLLWVARVVVIVMDGSVDGGVAVA